MQWHWRWPAAVVALLLVSGCAVRPPGPPGRALRGLPGAQPAGTGVVAAVPAVPGAAAATAPTQGAGADSQDAPPQGMPPEVAAVWHWEGARTKLFPMVVSADDIPSVNLPAPLVAFPLLDEAVVAFVVDLPDRWLLLSMAELQRWQVPPDDFFSTALDNLLEATVAPQKVKEAVTGQEYLVYSRKDGFDSARILLLGVWQELAGRQTGKLVIAIPARDRLYAFPDTDPNLVSRMRELTDQDFSTLPHPVTRTWFTVDAAGSLQLYGP